MRSLLALSLTAGLAVAACHGTDSPTGTTNGINLPAGLVSCSSSRPFTVSPLPIAFISGWVPLGNLNPPAHTFPTDHQYLYLTAAASLAPLPLVAPGDLVVTSAKTTRYGSGTVSEDYAVTFMPCQQLLGEFGHVRTLSPALLQALGPFNQQCTTYSPDGTLTVTQCYSKETAVTLKAGDAMGTAAGLDFTLFDTRIPAGHLANDSRWMGDRGGFDHFHVVPASDYFEEPVRAQVWALLGLYDGRVKRTVEPLGGTIYTDVTGTVQGTWFKPGAPTYPESPHLAIVPDNVDPRVLYVSVGLSQTGLSSGAYRVFPLASGTTDRDPSQITPGTTAHCYDLHGFFGFGNQGALLLQLVDATTLKVEARTGGATCASLATRDFTAAVVTYVR